MPFEPDELPPQTPSFQDSMGDVWLPLYRHACSFAPDLFLDSMTNMVRNPNLNSSWLFRADILYDDELEPPSVESPAVCHLLRDVRHMQRHRTLVRRLIPRNRRRDAPLDQTCTFHRSGPAAASTSSLVL